MTLLAALLSWLSSCGGQQHPPGVAYYKGFRGYNLPWRPTGEISESAALSTGTYIRATYDQRGLLVTFEQLVRGKLWFRHDYEYDADGDPVRARISGSSGKTVVKDL
jgi:hypothetical protein